ncbi:hypothetical protein BaRGS_00036643 [Batillaria attramentaria]|uniref:MAM domain-containing protein n=1 Tax=Batillaria attramentaria TaxID=370345 RepID=A0ABD0JAV7_9CAEN
MRTLLRLSYILACAVLIVSAENNDPDVTVIEEYTAANCDFERDWCGWTNKDDSNATVKWRPWDRIFGSDYVVADLSGKPKGSLALLASPWFKPNEHRQCSLRFRFFKGDTDACELAVTVATATSKRKIWSRTRGTFLAAFSTVPWIDIPFTDKIHRIVFEGRQLTGGSCGFYREIGVDDIRFRYFRASEPTHESTTTPPTTTQKRGKSKKHRKHTAGQNQIPPQTDEAEDHFKIGLIDGFAVAAVVVVVCIVVLVLVLRRRQVEKPRKTMDIHVADEGTFPDDVTRGHPGQQSTTTARREPIENMAGDYQEISDVDTTTHGLISNHGHQDRRRQSHIVQYHAGLERDNLTNRSGTTPPVVTANAATNAGDYEQFTGRAEPSHYTALDAPADDASRGAPVPGNYEQLTTRPESSHYTALANDASQAGPSGDNYELLSARPESSHYTALANDASQAGPSGDNYELLSARPESSHYTALANDASQAGPSGDNYELLSARPESSHYTALASTSR